MNLVTIRLIFAGLFGLSALLGAIILELTGQPCPPWLVGIVGLSAGFVFGHVQANGLTGKH